MKRNASENRLAECRIWIVSFYSKSCLNKMQAVKKEAILCATYLHRKKKQLSVTIPFYFPFVAQKELYCQGNNCSIIDVSFIYLVSILLPIAYRIILFLCLQIEWQLSHRRKASGVLGSPETFFVAHWQARIKMAVANIGHLSMSSPSRTFR